MLANALADRISAGPLTAAELRDRLQDLQRATLEQMLELGPDPARLALMSGIRATLEAMEETIDAED